MKKGKSALNENKRFLFLPLALNVCINRNGIIGIMKSKKMCSNFKVVKESYVPKNSLQRYMYVNENILIISPINVVGQSTIFRSEL